MRHVFLPLLLPLVAVAAPVPKEKLTADERVARLWGKAVLPDEKCSATADVGSLTLASDGGCRPELFETTSKTGTGVRTAWPASGDFEATVRLVRSTEPVHAARSDGVYARTSAGLYVGGKSRHDVQTAVWVGRQLLAVEGKGKKSFDHSLWLQESGSGTRMTGTTPDEATWVRISRSGDQWECGWSGDGKKWATRKVDADLSDAVTVGVFLTHSSGPKCEASFSDFVVTPPKPAEKK